MRWTLWVDPVGRPGRENMQRDYALLRAAQQGDAFLRLYRWDPPCLSFGRNEPVRRRYDFERIARRGIDIIRRPTGGRAVWHDAEVTYAVAAPLESFGSLRETYLTIHTMFVGALKRLGVAATLAPRPPKRSPGIAAGACFAAPVEGEVLVAAKKLIGSAQLREGSGFLQHGSLLLRDSQSVVSEVTKGVPPLQNATALDEALGRSVSFDEVAAVVADEARRRWSGPWTEKTVSTSEVGSFTFEISA